METNPVAIERGLKSITAAAEKAYQGVKAGNVSLADFNKLMDRAEKDQQDLLAGSRTRKKALGYSSGADSADSPFRQPARQKGVSQEKWAPPSPNTLSMKQWSDLFQSAVQRQSGFTVKAGVFDGVGMKSPTGEGTPGSLLPPELIPQAFEERYEPDRLWAHLPGATADGQWVSWLRHVSNSSPADVGAELSNIVDVGMVIEPFTATFARIGGLATFSRELLDDFSSFMAFVPNELARSVIDAETNFLINNQDVSNGWSPGLFYTEGVLTRNASASDTPIDGLVQAISDVRSGSSFGIVNLIAVHPDTWMGLRTQKATTGLYILDQNTPNNLGQSFENFFGVRIVQNSYVPLGYAIALDTDVSTIAFTRQGIEVQSNWAGEENFSEYSWSFRAVERIALAVTRPTGICIVSGLPYTPWAAGS